MILTIEEKLAKGKELKDLGSSYFKQGDLKNALLNYHQAILYLAGVDTQQVDALRVATGQNTEGVDGETQDAKKECGEVLAICYTNLAACLLKQEKWHRVIENCDKALKLQPDNKKALFRRAQANFAEGNIEKARQDLEQCDKNDPAVIREFNRIKSADKAAYEKQRKEFKGLFDRMAKEEEGMR